MIIFVAICIFGFIVLVGGALFGHDHDFDHDHDFGADHDHGGHEGGGGNEPTVSIFSLKVIGTFVMGFGGGGAIAAYYGNGPVAASLWGLGVGLVMGAVMYLVLWLLYGQQSTSLVDTNRVVGQTGTVTVGIDKDAVGEIEVDVGTQRATYLAKSATDRAIPRGRLVRVVANVSGQLVVEELPRA